LIQRKKFMKCFQKISISLALIISIPFHSMNATITLKGDDVAGPDQTFSFPMLAHVASSNGDNLFLGSHPTLGSPKNFSLAATIPGTNIVRPLALNPFRVNGQNNQQSPLYDSHIRFLTLLTGPKDLTGRTTRDEWPAVVITESIASVYILDTFFRDQVNLLSADNIKDASGSLITSGIVGLGYYSSSFAIAAVKPHEGDFGDPGSGLAMLLLDQHKIKEGEQEITARRLHQVDAPYLTPPVNPTDTRALDLDKTSVAIKINSNLSAMTPVINFAYDDALNIFYGALQVVGGNGANDGAIGLFKLFKGTGDISTKFLVTPIIFNTAFTTDPIYIVGGISPQTAISLHAIKTMNTSTHLNYLIVQGGNGQASITQNQVFALPLVNKPNELSVHGMIADKNEIPAKFSLNFGFKTPAMTPEQMTTTNDGAALVGGGSMDQGDIVSMFVKDDSVFVSVFNPDNDTEKPGLFYSQALLDENGKIKNWTQWQRVAGIDPTLGASYNTLANFTYMTGDNLDNIKTIKRTQWGSNAQDGLLGGNSKNASVGLISILSTELPTNNGGIQGMFECPKSTPGLNNISLLIATGNDTVVLAEMANSDNISNAYSPNYGDFAADKISFKNGIINQTLPDGKKPRIVTISGGALSQLGPITAAQITCPTIDGQNGRLFVGGTSGLAVLVAENGDGWLTPAALTAHFQGLQNGMRFKKIGNYSFVRKLISDDNFLYVMTDKKVDRIDLTLSNFATEKLSLATIAHVGIIPGINDQASFTDFIPSGKLALLASTKGMHRSGNGKDIRTISDPAQASWTSLSLPETLGPVTELIALTTSGRAQDIAKSLNSNVYALNAYVGKKRAQITRFTIQDVSATPVDDNTVQLIPDFFVLGAQSPFYNFNGFKDHINADGTVLLHELKANFGLKSAVGFSQGTVLPLTFFNTSSIINRLARSSASGAWLIGGNFGLQVNE
jgi:hypothetical protein